VLFNSYEFIFLFLPVTLAVFFALGARGAFTAASAWLAAASIGFYSYWNPWHVPIVLGSIFANYWIGTNLSRRAGKAPGLLALGVTANLLLLALCKYRPFVIENLNTLLGLHWPVPPQVLPLGVSFFTFTQIAFLVDAHRGGAQLYPGLRYGLFVLFFPHLIAGPIVHHHQLIPQLGRREIFRFQPGPFACGLTLFTLGLAKKVIFADSVAAFARPVFAGAALNAAPGFVDAWVGALSFTLQLYFDFSGYSDMALGLARMFDVKFPVNFNSPYKATSIVDFWRRWHITLSQFLRDYLYIPLGGSRCGKGRHYVNLFLTMLLGGIWHGAGWTFAIWGAWHGLCLCINHLWRASRSTRAPLEKQAGSSVTGRLVAGALTFLCVVIGWVFFKSASIDAALHILGGMVNIGTISFAEMAEAQRALIWIAALLAIVWFAPNSQQLLAKHEPALNQVASARVRWQPTARWALIIAILFCISVLHLSQITEFIYFQF
jgi:alginate O-acetyltransferase complex protein AlgI